MKKQWNRIFAGLLLAMLLPVVALADTPMNREPYVTTVYNERNGLPTGEANVVYQTSDHYVWIGSYGGLVRYDGSNFRNFSQEGLIPSASIRAILEDDAGRLWVGTNDAGLFVYENGEFSRVPEAGDPVFLCIRALAKRQDGTVYVASSSGLAYVREGVLTSVEDHPLLTEQAVYSLGVDAYGRVWAALNDWQCAVVQDAAVVGVVQSEQVFQEGQQIYAVTSDGEGRIYLGTYQNTVARVTLTGETLEPASFAVETFSTGNVTIHNALSVTEGGHMLVCGQLGFAWLDPQGQLRQFGEEAHAAALNSAIMDYEGNFWLASGNYGVIKCSIGCFDTPNHLVPGLADVAVNTIVEQSGRYYLGLDNGLLIFDENWQPVTNTLTQLLKGIRIRQVLAGSDGTVWLATYSNYGTICYDPATDISVYYTADAGMDNCWTRTLLELQDGTIAAGTSDGFYLLRDGMAQAYYGHDDGLGNTTILCFAQAEDGTLYIGTDGGGMYALKDSVLTHHGTSEGLGEGVVLRILPDEEKGLFVSAGSSLYYWENNQFRKLDRFNKAPGSVFDFYLRDGQLWLLQNNGILVVDKAQLLNGQYTEAVTHSFGHGLTGSLNANTWNHLTEDGRLYLSTRSGISIFGFRNVENTLPSGIINDIRVDGKVFEHPEVIHLSSDTHRITLDFAMLSYADTSQSRIAYWLEGLDLEEGMVDDQKNGSISYTNLPGGEYTFHMRVYNPDAPQQAHHYQVSIIKEKRLTEQPLFWVLSALAFALMVAAVITTISHLRHRVRIRRMNERQQELQEILVQSLQVFARVIDAKDPYTNGHSIRVAQYARELARRMGLPEEEQERIYYIALLHDIGKIGIPDNILNKQGALTPEERAIIQTHPSVGGQVLKNFTALSDIDDGARYHHERYDGKGYCEGLGGKDIPLVARIIGVADSYDAMSSDRVYRPALSCEKIVSELKTCSGTQFDPEIVPYMLEMIEDGVVPAKETPEQDVDLKLTQQA